jgi:glycosyltransferase involved in cell wall biosynthesis
MMSGRHHFFLLLFFGVFVSVYGENNQNLIKPSKPRQFVVVTASYNNEKWVLRYLESVFSQDYKRFRVIYCDDCSTDKTLETVMTFIKKRGLAKKVDIMHNSERVGPHENYYNMIHSCHDNEIAVVIDGDDWLAHNKVLSHLAKVYGDSNVWITYGSHRIYPSGKLGCHSREIPHAVIEKNAIRSYPWVTSHLRTFYAWLYKQIKIEDLIFDGKFVRRCGDMAIMLPMIEMAGFHSRFIPDVLLIYNKASDLNYGKTRGNVFASNKDSAGVSRELRENRFPYVPLELSQEIMTKLCGF